MIQRRTRDYEVSLWSLQDSFIAVLKQYGLEYKGQIENGKLADRDDGTQTFSFDIPMYYHKHGEKIENPGWYSIQDGALLVNMRKIKVIFNKDNQDRKIYEFLIVSIDQKHDEDNSLYCHVECEGLAFHELGKIGYKIALSQDDFYNDDYDWATKGKWYNAGIYDYDTTQPLATLNYWNDKVFDTVNNWGYEIQMNWDSHSLQKQQHQGVTEDYVSYNDVVVEMVKRSPNKVYEEDFIDSWQLENNKLIPKHITYAREKARVSIDLHDSNIYNITQSLAETFGVFCKYVYEYDDNCHIINKKVIYYNNFLNESDGLMDIIYPYQTTSIKRNIDSTDLVTKLFVKSIEDDSGMLSIIDVGANKSQEDYLLNFDYLYQIGGITQQQYQQVDKYLIKMRELNDDIAPLSAKVISLQSQLTNLEAELTTRKNAIAQDTQQLLANNALLQAITNGDEVLSINASNPQTAVLIKDTSENSNSYYVKITQKGVYAETIKLYKTYSYRQSKLTDEIETGVVVYDDSGEVIKVSNIFINELVDSKTVYITYDYRPILFYERIVALWRSRLNEDTIRKEALEQEIGQLKFCLYGWQSNYDMTGIDVSKLLDYNIYNRYENLLKQKQETIKQFNAIMGPALREGYWQPEDYNDYGDKYNDKLSISPTVLQPSLGATGYSYFKWDDTLFEGQQDLYYPYTVAEFKQSYPCIDLSKHLDILKMIVDNPDLPISFVYTPTTASQDNPYPTEAPIIDNHGLNEIVVIPNLYTWNSDTNQVNINSNFVTNAPNVLKTVVSNNYNGLLQYDITNGWKYGYTTFHWQMKNLDDDQFQTIINFKYVTNSHNIEYKNSSEDYCHLIANNNTNKQYITPYLQLLSNSNETLSGATFRLMAANKFGSNSNISDTKVRLLGTNTISIPTDANVQQHIYKGDASSTFIIKYKITNTKADDMKLNYYTWSIDAINDVVDNIEFLSYLNPDEDIELTGNIPLDDNNKTIPYKLNVNKSNNIHTLTLFNTDTVLNDEKLNGDHPLRIKLNVKTPENYINNTSGKSGIIYNLYCESAAPWLVIDNDNTNTTLNYDVNKQKTQLNFMAYSNVINEQYNNITSSIWEIKAKNSENWVAITSIENSYSCSFINEPIINKPKQKKIGLVITITNIENACNNLIGASIRCRVNNNQGSSGYKQFNNISIINNIIISSDRQLSQPQIIIIKDEPTIQNTTYTQHSITIKAQNALQYEWEIIPADDNNNPINFKVDRINPSNSAQSNRYQINYNNDNSSTLTIQIPITSQSTKLRDNGTQVRCICSNNSDALAVVIPAANEFSTLRVSHSLTVLQPQNNKNQWWCITNQSKYAGSIIIDASNSINDQFNKNNLQIIGSVTDIYDVNNDTYYPWDNNSNNKFQITYNIIEMANENFKYQCELNLKYNGNLGAIAINNTPIVDITQTSNDSLYKLKCSLIIFYTDQHGQMIIYHECPYFITIRQNVPQVDSQGQGYWKRCAINEISATIPAYIISNQTFVYDNFAKNVNTNNFSTITIYADDSKIFSLNIASVNNYAWKPLKDSTTATYWQEQTNAPLIIGRYSSANVPSYVPGVFGNGPAAKYLAGYSGVLYLVVQNAWGAVVSKIFKWYKDLS